MRRWGTDCGLALRPTGGFTGFRRIAAARWRRRPRKHPPLLAARRGFGVASGTEVQVYGLEDGSPTVRDLDEGDAMTWAPAECTLPFEERPGRAAEFDELFAAGLRGLARPEPELLLLTLEGTDRVEAMVRDLTMRERACCPMFEFTIGRSGDGALLLEVRVADGHAGTLEALAGRAGQVMRDRTP
jgi:hypothetical protein